MLKPWYIEDVNVVLPIAMSILPRGVGVLVVFVMVIFFLFLQYYIFVSVDTEKSSEENVSSPDSSIFKTPAVPHTSHVLTTPHTPNSPPDAGAQQKLDFEEFRTPSPSQTSHSSSLSRTPGTPLPNLSMSGLGDSSLGKTSLPTAEQFRMNVEEHILFENLPDSTGVYNRMRRVISDIRELKKSSL